LRRLAHLLFAAGMAGLGALGLLSGDFAMNWQPVPDSLPFRAAFAYASGAILLAGGLGMFFRRTAAIAVRSLTAFLFLWLLVLQLPRVAARPLDEGMWLGFCETTVLSAGAWILSCFCAAGSGPGSAPGEAWIRAGRLSFAAALPLIGLSHYVYVGATAAMVPAWLPAHVFFAYLTGTGHIAAGAGLLLGVLRRAAAVLEAAMMSCFVLLLHIPGVWAAAASRLQWTMLFVATALTAAGWSVAASLFEEGPGPGPSGAAGAA
jgi:uncharacterized membrane protein